MIIIIINSFHSFDHQDEIYDTNIPYHDAIQYAAAGIFPLSNIFKTHCWKNQKDPSSISSCIEQL